MPVMNELAKRFKREQPFAGKRIAVSVHIEAKTAVFATILAEGGAEVAITGCNPLSTQDDVAAALAEQGLCIYAFHGATSAEYTRHLQAVLDVYPHVVIDDGGDLADLLHSVSREKGRELVGICEETTTGVQRLRNRARAGTLLYPAIAVNDAKCKHLFDNRFGTGQSVWTAIMSLTNLIVAGTCVVVAGFGMCGKGVALRAGGLGARVIVTEIDPIAAAEAVLEGYEVMPMDEAAALGDIFVTVTGCKDVLTERHFAKMKDGAILSNAGHFDVEISLVDLTRMAEAVTEQRRNVTGYRLPDGRVLNVLAAGRLVNLAGGDGHPAEIMDLSFALQSQSALHLSENGSKLAPAVYNVPAEIDRAVAEIFLKSRQLTIDVLTPEQALYLNADPGDRTDGQVSCGRK